MSLLIGMTYDLRSDYLTRGYSEEETAEFDKEETIDGLANVIRETGHTVDPVGSINALTEKLAQGKRWDLVFNIAEGCHGMSREAQVPALLDAYRIPYTMSDPISLAITHHKGITKQVVAAHGVPTPAFALVKTIADVDTVTLKYPLFAKPVAEGTGKGISRNSKIRNIDTLRSTCAQLLEKFKQPVLVEEFLPGREFTVGILGNNENARILGVMEIVYNRGTETIYSYETKSNYEELVTYSLVEGDLKAHCADMCLNAYRALGCRDASRIDLRVDAAGVPNFMEINALPGLNPVHSDLPIMGRLAGVDYQSLVKSILDAAISRYPELNR